MLHSVNIERKESVNGCSGASFGDLGVLQGDRIPYLKRRGRALEEEIVSMVSSVIMVIRLPIGVV